MVNSNAQVALSADDLIVEPNQNQINIEQVSAPPPPPPKVQRSEFPISSEELAPDTTSVPFVPASSLPATGEVPIANPEMDEDTQNTIQTLTIYSFVPQSRTDIELIAPDASPSAGPNSIFIHPYETAETRATRIKDTSEIFDRFEAVSQEPNFVPIVEANSMILKYYEGL